MQSPILYNCLGRNGRSTCRDINPGRRGDSPSTQPTPRTSDITHAAGTFRRTGLVQASRRRREFLAVDLHDDERVSKPARDIATLSIAKDRIYCSVLTGPASNRSSEAAGMMCFHDIFPSHCRLEIGSVILSETLRQSRQATEAFCMLNTPCVRGSRLPPPGVEG